MTHTLREKIKEYIFAPAILMVISNYKFVNIELREYPFISEA